MTLSSNTAACECKAYLLYRQIRGLCYSTHLDLQAGMHVACFQVKTGHIMYVCEAHTCCMRCGYIKSCISWSDQCNSVSNSVGSCSMYPLTADPLPCCFSCSIISAIFSNLQWMPQGSELDEERACAACFSVLSAGQSPMHSPVPLSYGCLCDVWQL